MNFDDLDDLIRAANPGTRHRGDSLTPRAEAELAQLLQRRSARPRRRMLVVAAAVATIIALGGVAVIIATPGRATARTPALMHLTPTSLSVTEVVDQAAGRLAARPTIGTTGAGAITLHEWALNTVVGAHDRITSSSTIPSVHTLTFGTDGTVRLRIVAAKPFPGESSRGLPKTGTVLLSEDMKPGAYDDPYAGDIPTNPRLVGEWLARAIGMKNPTTGDYLQALGELMTARLVTNQQQMTLVKFLGTLPHLSVAGRAKDRLGRSAVVLTSAGHEPGVRKEYLLLSATTGRLIGAEAVYIGHDRTDIASPSVLCYFTWTQSLR